MIFSSRFSGYGSLFELEFEGQLRLLDSERSVLWDEKEWRHCIRYYLTSYGRKPMKTKLRLLISLMFAFATFMQNSSVSAIEIFKFRGDSVSALFTNTDGCIETSVFAAATQGISQSPPGPGSPVTQVALFILQYDFCTDTRLVSAEAVMDVPEADFQVSKKLEQATLNTTVTVTDFAADPPASFDVFIDLTWTATGPLSRQSNNSNFNDHGCNIHNRFHGTSRTAEASGSVSDGTINYTPQPSVEAFIMSANRGTVIVGCTP